MADALIETTATNPYSSIVADTTNQLNSVQADIQKVSDAISNLERSNPTHYLLPRLRERLSELQTKAKNLGDTNDSAKSLLTAYNESLANVNTMEGVYQLKQAELNRAQKEADQSYRKMADDVKRAGENYINALGNATASENAIINANAGREGASAQSTAEARARNYLANAQAQAEYYGNMVSNLNAINDAKLNSNAGYVQLSQSNADNTLRQNVMNNFEAQQNAYNRSGSGSSSRGTSNIVDPYEQIIKAQGGGQGGGTNIPGGQDKDGDGKPDTATAIDTGGTIEKRPITEATQESLSAGDYGNRVTKVGSYMGNWYQPGLLGTWDGNLPDYIANVDKSKVKKAVESMGSEDFNLKDANGWVTDKGYLILTNNWEENGKPQEKIRAIPLKDVSDWDFYYDENGRQVKFR